MNIHKPHIENKSLVLNPTLDEVKNAELRSFYELWLDLRKKNGLPKRQHFTQDVMESYIDDIAFLKFSHKSQRFMVEEMGQNIIDVLGYEVLGQYWDKMPGSEEGHARMLWAVENKLPYYVGWPLYKWSRHPSQNYSALCCPIFDDEGDVDALIFSFLWDKALELKASG